MSDNVVLVNKNNRKIGVAEKLQAHEDGKLHRAFSIFVFNDKDELLIQKRNSAKYHSGGLWSNTVCSHPRPGERYLAAAHRRLKEEIGFDCPLKKIACFIYKASFENGLTEHEYDCVFVGKYDGNIQPDPEEIEDSNWIPVSNLQKEIKSHPEKYTFWFKKIVLDSSILSQLAN